MKRFKCYFVDAFRKRDKLSHGGQETGSTPFSYDDVRFSSIQLLLSVFFKDLIKIIIKYTICP